MRGVHTEHKNEEMSMAMVPLKLGLLWMIQWILCMLLIHEYMTELCGK